jgi:osmotically-inducible protein OsmY
MTLSATSRSQSMSNDQSDLLLRERLLAALRESGYAPLSRLDCHVTDCIVELSGSVSSFYLKQLAQTVAMRIETVRTVRNGVVVEDRVPQLATQSA